MLGLPNLVMVKAAEEQLAALCGTPECLMLLLQIVAEPQVCSIVFFVFDFCFFSSNLLELGYRAAGWDVQKHNLNAGLG